ncbi:MAG: nuclear transport factor 2 family protein [Lewinellaceae bacterium]|nr:nuclear transport factor 2 family protein [Lewinellaceae bacterium]
MTTAQIAQQLVEHMRQNQFPEAYANLFTPDFESIEPAGAPFPIAIGVAGLKPRIDMTHARLKSFVSGYYGDPIVAGDYFSLAMGFEAVTVDDEQVKFDEICVYEVKDGRIIREQFFYTPGAPWI